MANANRNDKGQFVNKSTTEILISPKELQELNGEAKKAPSVPRHLSKEEILALAERCEGGDLRRVPFDAFTVIIWADVSVKDGILTATMWCNSMERISYVPVYWKVNEHEAPIVQLMPKVDWIRNDLSARHDWQVAQGYKTVGGKVFKARFIKDGGVKTTGLIAVLPKVAVKEDAAFDINEYGF